MAGAFSKVLGRPIAAGPAFPSFATGVILPFFGLFVRRVKDMHEMMKWMRTGVYTSKNTQKQKELFGDLPTIEEAVRRYCRDRGLV
jgi:hypothetical protein